MRRCVCVLYSSYERDWRSKVAAQSDRTGRFNLAEAAAELQLDEEYVASLYRPLWYTYYVKGQLYPAERGRASKPGSLGCTRQAMFPLYRRSKQLTHDMREVDWRDVSTE